MLQGSEAATDARLLTRGYFGPLSCCYCLRP